MGSGDTQLSFPLNLEALTEPHTSTHLLEGTRVWNKFTGMVHLTWIKGTGRFMISARCGAEKDILLIDHSSQLISLTAYVCLMSALPPLTDPHS